MNNTANEKLANAAPKKKRRIASLDKKKARAGYIFVLPFIIGLVAMYLPIIYDSILYSFTNIKHGADGYQLMFVGLENYRNALFVDTTYVQVLTTGIKQLFLDIPCIVIFSLFMAVLLNQKMVGRAAFRAIFFVPVVLSTGLVAKIDAGNELLSYMQNTDEGISTGAQSTGVSEIVSAMDFKYLFSSMKVGKELVDYVIDAINNIYNIVNRSGVQMLIFLAGLQSISPAIYESCEIEGASAWETFWKITFPMISPMILTNAVYTIIDAFTSSTNTVMSYIDQVYGKTDGDVLSSAMAWMYFIIVIAIIAAVAGLLSMYTFYQRRD